MSQLKPDSEGDDSLGEFLRTRLFAGLQANTVLVLVVTDEESLGSALAMQCGLHVSTGMVVCKAFDRRRVVDIMQSLARTGGFDFESGIIEDMADSFEQSRHAPNDKRFTLAHMHAICHVLASKQRVVYDGFKGAFADNLDALHQAINVVEFMSFAEDCDYPISAWIRNMVKVPLRESKERIAEFIKAHYDELLPPVDRRAHRRNGQSATGGKT
jgi:hypothetical protein